MEKHTPTYRRRDLPELDALKKELKRERYKRRFRRLLRSTVNAMTANVRQNLRYSGLCTLLQAEYEDRAEVRARKKEP